MFDAEIRADAPRLRPQPGEVWSLWEMLKFYATSFLAIGEHMATVDVFMSLAETPLNSPRFGEADGDALAEDAFVSALTEEELEAIYQESAEAEKLRDPAEPLKQVVELAERLELPVSAALIRETLERDSRLSLDEYRLLKKALYTEIKGQSLLYMPRERAKYYENDGILSDTAKAAFGTAYVELREAGSCYATGRFTGAVLHCMRAAEVGVKALGRQLGYAPDDLAQQDWHGVLEKCESLIQDIRDKKKKGPEKEEVLKFYSQAATQFRHFKDGWRVQAAHTRPPFQEGEALDILRATISFYELLATQLSENAPAPIAS